MHSFDLDDLRPSALKRMLKEALLKGDLKDKAKHSAQDDEDARRESLVDLHESKGDSKPPKVTSDDLPEELRKVASEDDSDEKEPPKKSGKKVPPQFAKKGSKKNAPPFAKKGK